MQQDAIMTVVQVRIRSKEVRAEIVQLLADRHANRFKLRSLFAERQELSAIWDCFLDNQDRAYARQERFMTSGDY